MDSLQSDAPERNAQISIVPDLTCQGDVRLLEIALVNLLGNAWKFTSHNQLTSIEVGVKYIDEIPAFYVKDNGVGFDMKYADKLFKTFHRLHKSNEFKGTGIGLATVKRIIERHNGKIWVDSIPGEGTTFYFNL
jgi:light-regulated signal transduction histidine kinase (bacteriophytochrome)